MCPYLKRRLTLLTRFGSTFLKWDVIILCDLRGGTCAGARERTGGGYGRPPASAQHTRAPPATDLDLQARILRSLLCPQPLVLTDTRPGLILGAARALGTTPAETIPARAHLKLTACAC